MPSRGPGRPCSRPAAGSSMNQSMVAKPAAGSSMDQSMVAKLGAARGEEAASPLRRGRL